MKAQNTLMYLGSECEKKRKAGKYLMVQEMQQLAEATLYRWKGGCAL